MDIEMIQSRMSQIDDLEEENRKAKELLKDQLDNSEDFQQINEKAREAAKKRRVLKDKILAESQNLVEDIRANNDEIKTLKEILSAELVEYHEQKKTDEIKDSKGEVRKFQIIVRLAPKGQYDKRDFEGKYTKEDV